jgi:hypothetical protein
MRAADRSEHRDDNCRHPTVTEATIDGDNARFPGGGETPLPGQREQAVSEKLTRSPHPPIRPRRAHHSSLFPDNCPGRVRF